VNGLIKLPHDLLAPCNSCVLMVLENQPPVHFWLVDELSKLQSRLELCWFAQVLLQPGLHDGNALSYYNWPENLIMTLFPTNGILLLVCNQKERCHAWSPAAMTSHVQTLSMLFFQDSTDMSITLFIPCFVYMTWLCLCVSNFDWIHSLLLVIIKLHPWDFIIASIISQMLIMSSMYPSFSFWPIQWGCFCACTQAHLHPEVSTPMGDHVYFRDSFTKGKATWLTKSSLRPNYSVVSFSRTNGATHCFSELPLLS
jgi:hypothetical protein